MFPVPRLPSRQHLTVNKYVRDVRKGDTLVSFKLFFNVIFQKFEAIKVHFKQFIFNFISKHFPTFL